MWHSDHEHTPEEIEVLKELERDLFMADPGLRSMWNNNFEEYFQALFDSNKWNDKQDQRQHEISGNMGLKMMQDPEYAKFMKEQAIFDEVLSGEMKIHNAPIEMQERLRNMIKEQEEMETGLNEGLDVWIEKQEKEENNGDPLLKTSKRWMMKITKDSGLLYEATGNIELFRIMHNATVVASKIVGATSFEKNPEYSNSSDQEIVQTDYTLSLISVRRCIESLEKLRDNDTIASKIPATSYIKTAKEIRQELIDRLDGFEQLRYKK